MIHLNNKFEKQKIKILKNFLALINDILVKYQIDKKYFLKEHCNKLFYEVNMHISFNEKNNNFENLYFNKFLEYLQGKGLNIYEIINMIFYFQESLEKTLSFEEKEYVNKWFNIFILYFIKKHSLGLNNAKKEIEKLYHIIDNEIIMSKTDSNGLITYVSTAFCNISGYTKEELIGKPHNIIRHPDNSKELYQKLWETIKTGRIWQSELKNKKKNGGTYWVFAKIYPEFDTKGSIIGYTALRTNISDKKELELQQKYIIEQSKNAGVGEMISMIVHQWRQPLQVISLGIQSLELNAFLSNTISNDDIIKSSKEIVYQLDYMSKTIDDFRDFLKPNKDMKEISLFELQQKIIEFTQYLFKHHNITLINDIENNEYSKEIIINIHINEIIQVFINIIKNACDELIKKTNEERIIKIDYSLINNSLICINIIDNAGGIPENIINKIFEPYFSTKSKNGTGLGLYMCQKIVNQHKNGNVSVENIKNGAKFKIQLEYRII